MFFNQKDTFLLVNPFQESILLPEDFINMLPVTALISPPGQRELLILLSHFLLLLRHLHQDLIKGLLWGPGRVGLM